MTGKQLLWSFSDGVQKNDEMPPLKRRKVEVGKIRTANDNHEKGSAVLRISHEENISDSEKDREYLHENVKFVEGEGVTELEIALPHVSADQEIINSYEAKREIGGSLCKEIQERLNTGSWSKRKSSIYVDAFNLALQKVLEDESHLFDETEFEVFAQWKSLSYESQYLYVRLFLRKTSAWHRVARLGYHEGISDLPAAINDLQAHRDLFQSTSHQLAYAGEHATSKIIPLRFSFTFADASDVEIYTLEEASSLLSLDELRIIAKEAKVQGKNKSELLEALHRMSQCQNGLDWDGLKNAWWKYGRHKMVLQGNTTGTANERDESDIDVVSDGGNRNKYFIRKILANVGPCVRLSVPALRLFERVHLVYYRSTEWTEKSLTTMVLAQISRRVFPQYTVSRSANIFASRSILLEYESALRNQFRLDNMLERSGSSKKEGFEEILCVFEEVYPRWKELLEIEQRKEDCDYGSREGAYLRRFSPAWVYTRVVHKACYVLGRLKMYEREWQILGELLDQHLFHVGRRGLWYQRKALLEEHYMAILKPDLSLKTLDQQKRYWRWKSLKTCEHALEDRECHVIYHHDLQKRVRKLERNLKLAKREQHDFSHVALRTAVEITVTGIKVQEILLPTKQSSHSKDREKSARTIWIDEREGGGDCTVESMCLSWYRDQGWRGYHSEGGILRTIFAYLFYDVLFIYIPNVFQTPYQSCPLDLHTDTFYSSRASEINHRLVGIANGDAGQLIRDVHVKESDKRTCVVGLNWDFALDDLLEIAACFDGAALATICKVFAQEYQQRGGGIPDLFLWSPITKEVMFSEVKSENDRLSDTQRLWIHILTGAGIRVELCNAVAQEIRIRQI